MEYFSIIIVVYFSITIHKNKKIPYAREKSMRDIS